MNFFDRLHKETAGARAELYTVPLVQDAVGGHISLETYLAYLEQEYHHVKHTMPLLMLMGGRLPKEKEWLRRLLMEYINDETGHDEWILSDIQNAGGDADAVKNGRPGTAIELMNAYNYDVITRVNPMGYFGMIVALETASVELASQASEALQKSLGLGKECFSFLDSHGALDVDHTKFIGEVLNRIDDPRDQEDIIRATGIIYHLHAQMFRDLPHKALRQAA